jgi:hypothetical protein
VGDKNSNLDVSDIYRISKESLDMMIADKKAEEKSAIFAQYRKEGFISNISYYGSEADLGYGIKTKYWDK